MWWLSQNRCFVFIALLGQLIYYDFLCVYGCVWWLSQNRCFVYLALLGELSTLWFFRVDYDNCFVVQVWATISHTSRSNKYTYIDVQKKKMYLLYTYLTLKCIWRIIIQWSQSQKCSFKMKKIYLLYTHLSFKEMYLKDNYTIAAYSWMSI